MSDTPTPETDASYWDIRHDDGTTEEVVHADFARKLEHERDAARAELAELRRDKALWDWMESHGGTCALAEKTYLGDGVNAWAAWPIAMGDKYSAARSPRMAVAKAMEDWTRQTTIQEGGDK